MCIRDRSLAGQGGRSRQFQARFGNVNTLESAERRWEIAEQRPKRHLEAVPETAWSAPLAGERRFKAAYVVCCWWSGAA
eukprot:9595008-Alexandrium_andersonii.AAC.1